MADSGGCRNHMEHVTINTFQKKMNGGHNQLWVRVMYLLILTPATADDTTTYVTFQTNCNCFYLSSSLLIFRLNN